MSKIILYQCDMCRERGEFLQTFKVNIPVIEPDTRTEPVDLKTKCETYDLCEDCIDELRKYIQNFHKTKPEKKSDSDEAKSYVWFVEYNDPNVKKSRWTRENGPFTDAEAAKKALDKATLLNSSYQHRISCRVVPTWVVDFIECNILTKE